MIKEAFIQEYGMGEMEPEHKSVQKVLLGRGVPVTLFTKKVIDRRRLKLTRESLVVGEHPIVSTALKVLQVQTPEIDCYPGSIKTFLKRRVWVSTIGAVTTLMNSGQLNDIVFVKPKNNAKKFTGFIYDSPEKNYLFGGASKQTQVFCSEVVNWVSEFRVFVNNAKILGVKRYSGNSNLTLNLEEVERAIKILSENGESTAGYGIDFGVLESGQTALIEWNDGYALGAYNLDPELYTDLLISRWEELMNT